jgi:hypothetical protein
MRRRGRRWRPHQGRGEPMRRGGGIELLEVARGSDRGVVALGGHPNFISASASVDCIHNNTWCILSSKLCYRSGSKISYS